MRIAELGHAVYGILFVLYSRVLVGFLLVTAPAVLHAQHHRDGGQHGHWNGYGQHDHEQAVDGRLHHFGLFLDGHVFGSVAKSGGPLVGAVGARITGGALALVTATVAYHACPTVGARGRHALVHVPAAILPAEPGTTAAPEVVLQILARTTVGTRFGYAIVHLALAQVAHVPGYALTSITVGQRLARTAVLTRVLGQLTVVGKMTVGPSESGGALARVTGIVLARHTGRSVPARVGLTVVGRLVASRPRKSDGTMAQITSRGGAASNVVFDVHASSAVAAR